MDKLILLVLALTLASLRAVRAAEVAPTNVFPSVPNLRVQPFFPDPLKFMDGHHVKSRSDFYDARRRELKVLFEHYMYGPLPPRPEHVEFSSSGDYADLLDGLAKFKNVRIITGDNNAPVIDLLIILPATSSKPAPIFLAMDFCGNQAISDDPRIPITRSWVGKNCAGCSNNVATEKSRGTQMSAWPLATIIQHGYGLAAFYSADIDPDISDSSVGIYRWLARKAGTTAKAEDRGSLAAWAWGFSRCVDYLETDHSVDKKKIAVIGHSRNGKAALLAGAFDERIGMVIAHQAGTGGSSPSRSKEGESIKSINDHFPHWFNARFKLFNDHPELLPFDQNGLVALCAPRPVLFTAGTEDTWANPEGQFQILQAVDPVYHYLGSKGLAANKMPSPGKLVSSPLGFCIRPGKHSMTATDWDIFLDYADHQWGKQK